MESRATYQEASAKLLHVPRGKALLVDECPEDLQYYSSILEAYGYQVRACNSYQEGVRCLGDEVFDFVIVGQGTSKFEGSCVLERATEVNRSLPVLVVARCLDMGCYLEAMQLGAVDYLVEPLTAWEVCRVLKSHPPVQSMAASMSGAMG
jgi:DNA-binding NtrC family response regulator